MANKEIRGKFEYKKKKDDKKKNKKQLEHKRSKKEQKKFERQTQCNHRDTKGKMHTTKVEKDGVVYKRCELCKELLLNDKTLLSHDAMITAKEQMVTAIGGFRSNVPISPKQDKYITNALSIIKAVPEMVDAMNQFNDKKKKDKNKKKNKRKKGKREMY